MIAASFFIHTWGRAPIRLAICVSAVLLGLLGLNIGNLGRLTPLTFAAFAVPYLVYLFFWFFLLRMAMQGAMGPALILSIVLLLLLSSYHVVKSYYYDFLPRYGIVFFSELTPERKALLIRRVAAGQFALVLIVVLDALFWRKMTVHAQVRTLLAKLDSRSASTGLSAHFLRSLLQLLRLKNRPIPIEALQFFGYVIDKQSKVMVSFEEEWTNVLRLITICDHRSISVRGEPARDAVFLNSSIPGLSLLTWLENALHYSIEDPAHPITLTWTCDAAGYRLQIANRIAEGTRAHTEKSGLHLLHKIMDNISVRQYEVDYVINEQDYIVTIRFFKSPIQDKYG